MAPFEKAPLRHIPNVDILGAPPLVGFVNRKLLLDCADNYVSFRIEISYVIS